jgi:hypothetical protein
MCGLNGRGMMDAASDDETQRPCERILITMRVAHRFSDLNGNGTWLRDQLQRWLNDPGKSRRAYTNTALYHQRRENFDMALEEWGERLGTEPIRLLRGISRKQAKHAALKKDSFLPLEKRGEWLREFRYIAGLSAHTTGTYANRSHDHSLHREKYLRFL